MKNPMRQITLLVVVLDVTPLSYVLAQNSLPLTVGDRVRVAVPTFDIDQYDGTVQALTGDTLVLQSRRGTGVSTLRMALVSITRLDIHRGRRGHSGEGATIGAVVGGIITLVAGLVACEDGFVVTRQTCIGLTTPLGLALGALLGAIVGANVVTDRWEEVPLGQFRVSLAPQRDGQFALGLSLRF